MDKYIIFGLLIVMTLLLIIHLNRNNNVHEKFQDSQTLNLQLCPAGLNYYSTDNAINCCTGPIVENKCTEKPACTLSESSGNLPRCIDWYSDYLKKQAKRYCPSDLPQFYEDKSSKQVGFCTASPLNQKLESPIRPDDPKCTIHKTSIENLTDPDSCLVKRMLKKMTIPTEFSIKSANLWFPGIPVVLQASYIDGLQTKSCLDRPSFDRLMDVFIGGWRNNTDFKTKIYDKMEFCDDIKRKFAERARDPTYKDPLSNITMGDTGLKLNARR